jgi:uracil-DNA glycosylase family 4
MGEPAPDCPLCPRLVAFREDNQAAYPDFHNGPVPSFGGADARLLIVGLAPGLKGANRTARPFTGDYAGDLLYPTLKKFGLAHGTYDARPDDGVRLDDCRITNAVRCVPPQNKPVGAEVKACRPFLVAELNSMRRLEVVLGLGGLAHNATLATLGYRQSAFKFGHGAQHEIAVGERPVLLMNSYHCSRYNTNTGRLTAEMFEDVFTAIRTHLDDRR